MAGTIAPYLYYEDGRAAVDWLCRAFGFTALMVMDAPDGRVAHAELQLGEGTIMLGEPGGDYRSPKRLGTATAGVHVYVDDVDVHFEQAKAAGATIRMEPTDQEYGDRRYDCEDLEGHNWFFATAMSPAASSAPKATEQTTA
jgi:PhnB protein